ncbi:MAG: site-specific integrase [Alphaproteobacteria bacterium]|nr:MAG: site-specific integrase [Alphaproteobacteria bacterium]
MAFYANAYVSSITPESLKRYERERRVKNGTRPASINYVRRELAVLASALSHAVKNGRLTSHPKIVLPPPGPEKDRHLEEPEISALLEACHEPHLKLFVLLAINTGSRKGAILELKWCQIDLVGRLIYLNPPGRMQTTKKRAIVPMNETLHQALVDAHADAPKTPYVIHYHGQPVADIKTSFSAACVRAGLTGVTPHTLRHTAGTLMAKAGVDMFFIGRVLGHSIQRTTEKYAHHRPEYLRTAVDVLGRTTSSR